MRQCLIVLLLFSSPCLFAQEPPPEPPTCPCMDFEKLDTLDLPEPGDVNCFQNPTTTQITGFDSLFNVLWDFQANSAPQLACIATIAGVTTTEPVSNEQLTVCENLILSSDFGDGICPDVDVDGDGIVDDLDNCPVDANADQLDSDGDGLGDVCDGCPLDAANDEDGDGLCGDIDVAASFAKGKVEFDKGKIKIDGSFSLPPGYWTDNLDPVGSATLTLAGLVTLDTLNSPFAFDISGDANKKWEYEDKDLLLGDIKKFKIDWKGSKFEFRGDDGLKIKSTFIGGSETTLQVEAGDVPGAFTLTVADTVIDYDADRNITANVPFEADKPDNKKVVFTLPYQLQPEMTLQLTGAASATVPVADHFEFGTVKFKVEAAFDPLLFPDAGNTTPQSLEFFLSLGETVFSYSLIDTGQWEEIAEDEWKF